MVFLVRDKEVIYRLKLKEEDDSLEEEEFSDFDCNMEIGIVIVDEAYEKFVKMDTKSFKERSNEEGMLLKIKRNFFQSTPQFEGIEISKVLHSILTARCDKKSTHVDEPKVILLSELLQIKSYSLPLRSTTSTRSLDVARESCWHPSHLYLVVVVMESMLAVLQHAHTTRMAQW